LGVGGGLEANFDGVEWVAAVMMVLVSTCSFEFFEGIRMNSPDTQLRDAREDSRDEASIIPTLRRLGYGLLEVILVDCAGGGIGHRRRHEIE